MAVITLSNKFLQGHPNQGKATNFSLKFTDKTKVHTIRKNYTYWKRIVNLVNNSDKVLSVRNWSGKPYASPQTTIEDLNKAGIEHIVIDSKHRCYIHGRQIPIEYIAAKDGLSVEDLKAWFSKVPFQAAIIHFTEFRYKHIIQAMDRRWGKTNINKPISCAFTHCNNTIDQSAIIHNVIHLENENQEDFLCSSCSTNIFHRFIQEGI